MHILVGTQGISVLKSFNDNKCRVFSAGQLVTYTQVKN